MSACDDMSIGLTHDEKKTLADFGCKDSFDDSYNYSYIAIIEDGNFIYECKSNRPQEYSNRTIDGMNYSIYSSGWYSVSSSSILVNDIEESVNYGGLNIVVYDKISGLVLDRVCFDLFYKPEERIVKRLDQDYLLREYEYYLIEGRTTLDD